MELFKSRTRVTYTNAVGDKVYPVVVDIKKVLNLLKTYSLYLQIYEQGLYLLH